jgi:hypothetical protein
MDASQFLLQHLDGFNQRTSRRENWAAQRERTGVLVGSRFWAAAAEIFLPVYHNSVDTNVTVNINTGYPNEPPKELYA